MIRLILSIMHITAGGSIEPTWLAKLKTPWLDLLLTGLIGFLIGHYL